MFLASINFLSLARLHVVGARLVTVAGVCRLYTRICNVTHQGQHAAGQSCYVPLGRHFILFYFTYADGLKTRKESTKGIT